MGLLFKTGLENHIFVFATIGTYSPEASLALMFLPSKCELFAAYHALLLDVSLGAWLVYLEELHGLWLLL